MAGNRLQLAWTDQSRDEAGFRVERKRADVGASDPWVVVGGRVPAGHPALTDYGMQPSQSSTYRARAFNAGGDSAYSNEADAATPVAGSKAHAVTKEEPR